MSKSAAARQIEQEEQEETLVEEMPEKEIRAISLKSILLPNSTSAFETDAKRLAKSIIKVGMLQPPAVEPTGINDLLGNPTYQVVYGRRRLRAAQMLKWDSVVVIVYISKLPEELALIAAREENFSRSSDFGATVWQLHELMFHVGLSETELCKKLQVSKNTLGKYLKLATLHPVLVEAIRDGNVSQAVANKIARLPKEHQGVLAEQVEMLIDTLDEKELESFRVTEEMVSALRNQVEQPLAEFLSSPLLLEPDSEDPEDAPEPEVILPEPTLMITYLEGYRKLLPGYDEVFDLTVNLIGRLESL